MFGVSRFYEESPQIKEIVGLIQSSCLSVIKTSKDQTLSKQQQPLPVLQVGCVFAKKKKKMLFRAPSQPEINHLPSYHCCSQSYFSNVRQRNSLWFKPEAVICQDSSFASSSPTLFFPLKHHYTHPKANAQRKPPILNLLHVILVILLLLFLCFGTQAELFKVVLYWVLKKLLYKNQKTY